MNGELGAGKKYNVKISNGQKFWIWAGSATETVRFCSVFFQRLYSVSEVLTTPKRRRFFLVGYIV